MTADGVAGGGRVDAGGQKADDWQRVAAPGDDLPAALAGSDQPTDILRALGDLEAAAAAHADWLKDWHLYVLGRLDHGEGPVATPPGFDFVGKFDALRESLFGKTADYAEIIKSLRRTCDKAQRLMRAVETERRLSAADYGVLMAEIHAFNGLVRQWQNDSWNRLANIDPLTGLGNRHAMMRKLTIERERQARNQQPCCVALVDLDNFKDINDTHGHAAGDTVLRSLASLLAAGIRPYDEVFRYGGDEFVVCLPNADTRGAWAIVERLRLRVSRWSVPIRGDDRVWMTVSVGVAPLVHEHDVAAALDAADQALYAAKRAGRNCVYVGGIPDPDAARPSAALGQQAPPIP